MTTVITVCGIGESTSGWNMLDYLVAKLPTSWRHVEVPWAASYAFVNPHRDPLGGSFDASLADGYRMLEIALWQHRDDDVVLAGYSGGAAVVGNLLARKRFDQVRAVVLVADPMAPAARGLPHGIAGNRPITHYQPIRWVSNPRDVICACPPDSPLRTIADQSAAMSLGDPAGWTLDLLDRVRTNRWQAIRTNLLDVVGAWRRYSCALDDVAGYLGLGRQSEHSIYSHDGSLTAAARWAETMAA